MIAEIISIGDELLIGQTINTNSSDIARQLTDVGITVNWITTVGDDAENIKRILSQAETRADVIIATGGLGPTHDDITKKVFSDYFNSPLILDDVVLENLRSRFAKSNMKLTASNQAQALVPEKARVIKNSVGTAPALLFEKTKKYFFVLPGVPVEMKAIMMDFIVPFLKDKNNQIIKKRVLHTSGIPESYLFEKLGDINALEKNAKIAFLPYFGRVDVRLTAIGESEQECLEKIKKVEIFIRSKVERNIWGTDDETFEQVIINKLKQQKLKLSVVELGTRGEIISMLTNDENPDLYFNLGFVIGSFFEFKKILKIAQLDLTESEIYSASGTERLVEQVRKITNSTISLGITFNLQDKKHAIIALSSRAQTFSQQYSFPYNPEITIKRLTTAALHQLYQFLTPQKIA